MLKILEPIMFAPTISVVFFRTAATEENNSGKEVPRATMVTPTINGEIFKARPILSAFSTNQSEPLINKNKLKEKINDQNIKEKII
jgi:uncharacterized protein YegJ (DUF2314 family)